MKFTSACLWVIVIFAGAQAPAQMMSHSIEVENQSTEILNLDTLEKEVLLNHPSLKAAKANWEAMKERVPQARAWDDLRAGVDVERKGTTRFDTFSDNEWMVSQAIPLSGKNKLRGKVALAEAASAFSELHRKELELISRLRMSYYRLSNAYSQYDLNKKNEELLKQLEKITQAKYEVGNQTQADILLAETELAKLEENDIEIKRQISDEESQINVLLNRKAQSSLGRPPQLTFKALEVNLNRLQSLALDHRPDFDIAKAKIEAADAKIELSKREWIPDPEIRVEARQFNGGKGIDEYDTGIFFNVPWLNPGKYKAQIREAEKMKESAEFELEATQTDTFGRIRDLFKKVETFHHHYELFQHKIMPLADQTITAKRLAYENNKSDFLELIMAQRTLQEIESMSLGHLTDYLMAIAELEAAVGIKLDQEVIKSKQLTPDRNQKDSNETE